jgi:hypothetical protein
MIAPDEVPGPFWALGAQVMHSKPPESIVLAVIQEGFSRITVSVHNTECGLACDEAWK